MQSISKSAAKVLYQTLKSWEWTQKNAKKMTYANKKEKKPAYDAGLMNEKTPNSKESPLSSASLVPPLNGGHHGCKGIKKNRNNYANLTIIHAKVQKNI